MAAGNTDWPSLPEAKAHSKQLFPVGERCGFRLVWNPRTWARLGPTGDSREKPSERPRLGPSFGLGDPPERRREQGTGGTGADSDGTNVKVCQAFPNRLPGVL